MFKKLIYAALAAGTLTACKQPARKVTARYPNPPLCVTFDSASNLQTKMYTGSVVFGMPNSNACQPYMNPSNTAPATFRVKITDSVTTPSSVFDAVRWFPTDKYDELLYFNLTMVPDTAKGYVDVTMTYTGIPVPDTDKVREVRVTIIGAVNDIKAEPSSPRTALK